MSGYVLNARYHPENVAIKCEMSTIAPFVGLFFCLDIVPRNTGKDTACRTV